MSTVFRRYKIFLIYFVGIYDGFSLIDYIPLELDNKDDVTVLEVAFIDY